MATEHTLSPQQERFCQEFIIDDHATNAAIRAGYSEKSAAAQASRLLTSAKIMARLDELRASQKKRLQISADTILKNLYDIATADITEAFDDYGGLKPFKEIPENVRKSISSLEVNELFSGQGDQKMAIGLNKKLRFWDKNRANELLGKHLKLFIDRMEHATPQGQPFETRDVSEMPSDERKARIAELLIKLGKTDA
jgi:phage terminase small subunit